MIASSSKAKEHARQINYAIRERHGRWVGDRPSSGAGHARARRWFKLPDLCERCKAKPPSDRHHKDGKPWNNEPSNIAFLCRACHMIEDGRIEVGTRGPRDGTGVKAISPCSKCGRPYKPLRRGMCNGCYEYKRYHGLL